MGAKNHYDKFVRNFMAGSKESKNDSPSNRNIDGPGEHTAHMAIESHDENIGSTDALLTPSVSSAGQNDEPEVTGGGDAELRGRVIEALKEVYDPEIPLNIYDLGLIYRIEIDRNLNASIDMTLTSPNCPVAGSLPGEVENAARSAEGVGEVVVELVWDPPWDMDRMGEAAKLELGLF